MVIWYRREPIADIEYCLAVSFTVILKPMCGDVG